MLIYIRNKGLLYLRAMGLPIELYIDALKCLNRIRTVETFIAENYHKQVFRCPVHLAIGHEALSSCLFTMHKYQRSIFSYHRSHHHFLASGACEKLLLYELGGSPKGCCEGYGGSHHLRNVDTGFIGSTPIISGTLPVATGFAHSFKLKKERHRVYTFMGDTIAEEGLFFECLNLASLYSLPITFVIEDNGLSCFTPKSERQGFQSYIELANSYKIKCFEADGASILSCLEMSADYLKFIEDIDGPCLIYNKVFRPYEHCGPALENNVEYRDISTDWPRRDPLKNAAQELRSLTGNWEQYLIEMESLNQNTRRNCQEVLEDLELNLRELKKREVQC